MNQNEPDEKDTEELKKVEPTQAEKDESRKAVDEMMKTTQSACEHFGKWEQAETDADCKHSSGKCPQIKDCTKATPKTKPRQMVQGEEGFTQDAKNAQKALLKLVEDMDDTKWLSQSQIATLLAIRVKQACNDIKVLSDKINYLNNAQRLIKHENGLWYVTVKCYREHLKKG